MPASLLLRAPACCAVVQSEQLLFSTPLRRKTVQLVNSSNLDESQRTHGTSGLLFVLMLRTGEIFVPGDKMQSLGLSKDVKLMLCVSELSVRQTGHDIFWSSGGFMT